MPSPLALTVLLHTRNEAGQIVACLDGLKGWAAEVVVADMASTDDTVTLAAPWCDRILQLPLMPEFDAARNISAEAATQSWILYLDADERLTPAIRETIANLVRMDDPGVDAYNLPFRTISFGAWIQHGGNWWPSYKSPPLLRKGRFRFSGKVHDPAVVKGTVLRVIPKSSEDAILHYSHRDLAHYFDKLNHYTTLEALKRDGSAASWERAAVGLGQTFAWFFDETLGRSDGLAGFFLSFGSAVYEGLTQLKLMEARGEGKTPPSAEAFLRLAAEAARQPTRDQAPEFFQKLESLVPGLEVTEDAGKARIFVKGGSWGLNWKGEAGSPDLHVTAVAHTNAVNILGGGEVQLFETTRALEACSVRCDVAVGEVRDGSDLSHLYSLHHEECFDSLRASGRPYVLSPIYWDRAELAWLAPKLMTAASRAETLSELEAAYDSLRNQADTQRLAGAFVSRLPDQIRSLVLGAAMVLPNAQCEADMLKASIGVDLPETRVIPNGASLASIGKSMPAGEGEPFVLCAGRLEVNKNQLALIAACRAIGVRLVLVGPELDQAYAALCRGVAGPNTEFLGARSRDDVHGLMARAALHALPSFAETPGLANLEAMGMGCPLVCSNRGAEREYFGDDALYCDPLDIGSIADALHSAMKRGRMKPQRQPITWDLVGRLTAEAYRDVLGRASGIGSGDE